MAPTRERATTLRLSDELERRLAVAVLEILSPQAKAMSAQQQLALLAGDRGDLVGGAAP